MKSPSEVGEEIARARSHLAKCLKILRDVAEEVNEYPGAQGVWRRNALYASRQRMMNEFRVLKNLREWMEREQTKQEALPQITLPLMTPRENTNTLEK